jgi:hypothetical protein
VFFPVKPFQLSIIFANEARSAPQLIYTACLIYKYLIKRERLVKVFVPGKPFMPRLVFVSKARVYLNGHLFWVGSRGCIFSCVRPLYELAVSDLDKSMHRSL